MAQDFSPDAIEAIYAEDGPAMSLLISLDSAGLPEPILASSDPEGTVSNGVDYPHFPFGFTFGGAAPDEPARNAKLEIANSDARIMRAIRSLPAGAQVSCSAELVLQESPDDVELAMTGARISDVESDDPKVTANIQTRSFSDEPANSARYIGARTPGLMLSLIAPMIGVPYLRRGTTLDGWDCMGCARYARETVFGLPWRSGAVLYGDDASRDPRIRADMILTHLGDWTLLGDKRADMREGAVLLFQYFGAPSHVATAVSSREFIHCLGGAATVLVDFDREPQWERRLRGVYD